MPKRKKIVFTDACNPPNTIILSRTMAGLLDISILNGDIEAWSFVDPDVLIAKINEWKETS